MAQLKRTTRWRIQKKKKLKTSLCNKKQATIAHTPNNILPQTKKHVGDASYNKRPHEK